MEKLPERNWIGHSKANCNHKKRKLEADALEARKEQARIDSGAARKAFRGEVASRPIKTKREVDNLGRVSVY